jgi:hypothetical protein
MDPRGPENWLVSSSAESCLLGWWIGPGCTLLTARAMAALPCLLVAPWRHNSRKPSWLELSTAQRETGYEQAGLAHGDHGRYGTGISIAGEQDCGYP